MYLPATRRFRIGMHVYGGPQATGSASLVWWRAGAADMGSIRLCAGGVANLNMGIYNAAGVQQDVELNAYTTHVYFHLGIDVKIDNSAGWVKVYVDNTEILSWTGNTGDADIDSVIFGGEATGCAMFSDTATCIDDIYIDDTTGEASPVVVPDRRFEYIVPDGNSATYKQCEGVGDVTDTWKNVDERPHDSDTTYNEVDTLDNRDTYTMTTVAVPSGWAIAAVIPYAYCKKTDGGTDTKIALALFDGDNDTTGVDQAAQTTYVAKWQRFTEKPATGAWDQAALDGIEIGFAGRGTF
jgi:hypothetical protein